ncbi:hypothetical protein AXX16_0339 [Serratia rubidaea]|nr:hypothetical protein AXX16_0339 [Serratia rubidaea]
MTLTPYQWLNNENNLTPESITFPRGATRIRQLKIRQRPLFEASSPPHPAA